MILKYVVRQQHKQVSDQIKDKICNSASACVKKLGVVKLCYIATAQANVHVSSNLEKWYCDIIIAPLKDVCFRYVNLIISSLVPSFVTFIFCHGLWKDSRHLGCVASLHCDEFS